MFDPKKIGGSDAGALVGMDPFKRPIDVWARIVEGREFSGNAATRRGLRFEGPIKEEYAEVTGARLVGPTSCEFPGRPHLRANLDDIAERDGEHRVLEVKTANFRMAHHWGDGEDEVPPHYLTQVNWYMRAARLPVADVAALLGGCELRIYTLKADSELQEMLLEAADKFWVDHVLTRKPPPPDSSDAYAAWLATHYPRAEADLLPSNPRIETLVAELRRAEGRFEVVSDEVERWRNCLKDAIGSHEGATGGWGKISWRNNRDSTRVDWEAVARELGATPAIVAKHTAIKPGPRVFRVTWNKEDKS